MEILCKLGFHDYEVTNSIPKYKLVEEIEEKYFNNYNIYIGDYLPLDEFEDVLISKTCLRPKCKKVVDEIYEFIQDYINEKQDKFNRKKIAESVHKNNIRKIIHNTTVG